MEKSDLKSLTEQQIEAEFVRMGQPKFRARQVYRWLHQKQVSTFAEMTDLPTPLRGQLEILHKHHPHQKKTCFQHRWYGKISL